MCVNKGLPPSNYKPSPTDLYKPDRSTSEVWTIFKRVKTYPEAVYCTQCSKFFFYAADGTTSNLRNHLKLCNATRNDSKQRTLKTAFQQQQKLSDDAQGLFESALMDLIIMQHLPISFVDGEYCRALFAQNLKSGLRLPASDKINRLLQQRYDDGMCELNVSIVRI